MRGRAFLKGIANNSPESTPPVNPPKFLANGYQPTLNQSEFGVPQISPYGSVIRSVASLLIGHQTYLPGPFHFADQVGVVQMGTYSTAPVVQKNYGFGGSVPLKMSPVYQRPAPWRR